MATRVLAEKGTGHGGHMPVKVSGGGTKKQKLSRLEFH